MLLRFNTALKNVNLCGHWLSENCEEFREMQIVRHAKYVGTMIGPDGHLQSLVGTSKNHPARAESQ